MRDRTHIHPLLIRGAQLTEKTAVWTLKEHPHTVAGNRRGFEVRVYHYPVTGWDPYFLTITSKEGWVMGAEHAPTAAAAQSAALEMLSTLTHDEGNPRRSATTSEAQQMAQAHADRVEHLTGTIIAAIAAAGANYPQAKHALTRALGALIGGNTQDDADRAAALSVANRAIAGCAESAPLIAKYGRTLRSAKSRLN
jgi:hypothetical protein